MDNITEETMAVTTNLDDLIAQGGTADKKIGVLVGNNLGNNTLLVKVPMHEFFEISEVANERNLEGRADLAGAETAQRPLDTKHAQKLAIYVLKGLANALANRYRRQGVPVPDALERIQRTLGKQPYLALQPLTANVRTCELGGKGIRVERTDNGLVYVYISSKDVLWVVDGQHRRFALQMLFEFLRIVTQSHRFPKRPALYPVGKDPVVPTDELPIWMQIFEVARGDCTIMVEVHLGLHVDQERQLFHDLNNLTKKVEASLAFQYDQSNPVNRWIKDELVDNNLLRASILESDLTDWHDDKGYISRKDLIAINAILFLNKTNVSGANPQEVDDKREFARNFWEAVNQIDDLFEDGAKQATVAAQPVVVKALAKLAYDFGFGKKTQDQKTLHTLIEGIPQIDFSHENPMWRYYEFSMEDRKKRGLTGLEEYLPNEKGANRDIGAYNDKDRVFRFGSKHNDIYPIIGDMIRWRLSLPRRSFKVAAETEETFAA
jgi:hypothetical protein